MSEEQNENKNSQVPISIEDAMSSFKLHLEVRGRCIFFLSLSLKVPLQAKFRISRFEFTQISPVYQSS